MKSVQGLLTVKELTYGLIRHEFPNVSRFLFELADGASLWTLVRIHQASRNFYDGRVDGWAPLLLEDDPRLIIRLRRVLKNGCNADAVNVRSLGSSETLSRLPCTLDTFGVSVGDSSDCQSSF